MEKRKHFKLIQAKFSERTVNYNRAKISLAKFIRLKKSFMSTRLL